jgi:hypothetical protein
MTKETTSRPVKKVLVETKSEKRARKTVVILSCFMALITICCAVLGSVTDIFKESTDEKAVAVLILPQEDKENLEKHLSKLWPLVDEGFDTQTMSAEKLFGYIRPYGENGLYNSFGYTADAVTHEADPAKRFSDENGSYCYYKITADEIDSILRHFGLEANHTLNSESCYYYDGFYYFASAESEKAKNSGKITVTDSKRIQDGRYYVTSKFGSKETYVIASMGEEGSYWKIHSMSTEPVFDSLGIKIKTDDKNGNDYEIRNLVIEGKADDGTVFSKYIIKYPYFFGDSQGEIQANNFYSSIIAFYRQQSEQVQSDYKKFIKKGGKAESLPIELHYSAEVSYSDEKYLCLINEIAESLPVYDKSQEDNAQQNSVSLAKKTMECYTFDIESGGYVSKDIFVGKDYNKVYGILYRIYNAYPYDEILDETVVGTIVPADTMKQGEKIYNSASTLCEDGYVFCFVTDEGIREDIVIPLGDLEKLTAVIEE